MKLWRMSLVGSVCAALLAPFAGASIKAPSGDTCTATGSGTTYTLVITLPSTASEQAAFAFGASGISVKNVKVVGVPQTTGSMSTQNLPANTTAAWAMATPGVPPGSSVTASLTTSGTVSSSFTVVPADSSGTTYLDPIVCEVTKATPPSNKFTVNQHVTYVAAARVWHLVVTIPAAGVVSAVELRPTVGTQSPEQKTAKSLVQTRSQGLKSAGKVTLVLKLTASGVAKLRAKGSLSVRMNVAFAPKGGKSASKIVRLTLRR